ncbi:ORF6N domain-containing protein [Steroidobacter sp.]|uniref:ORF6N domain-containing protein n=1 Tax=Steroidobacter sp. TaxID=1978227 RepID=UPI0039C9F2CD
MNVLRRSYWKRGARRTAICACLRGLRVLRDRELAALYQVQTKRLNEQVKRNSDRFPEDFMFRLTRAEVEGLNRSQNATGSQKHRDPRFPPYAQVACKRRLQAHVDRCARPGSLRHTRTCSVRGWSGAQADRTAQPQVQAATAEHHCS